MKCPEVYQTSIVTRVDHCTTMLMDKHNQGSNIAWCHIVYTVTVRAKRMSHMAPLPPYREQHSMNRTDSRGFPMFVSLPSWLALTSACNQSEIMRRTRDFARSQAL